MDELTAQEQGKQLSRDFQIGQDGIGFLSPGEANRLSTLAAKALREAEAAVLKRDIQIVKAELEGLGILPGVVQGVIGAMRQAAEDR